MIQSQYFCFGFPTICGIIEHKEPKMKYYKYLYVSDNIKEPQKVKRNLNLYKGAVGIYLVTLCNDPDQVEIINSLFLKLPYYRKHPPVIVGIAGSYDDATKLVIDMINESMFRTGSASLKDFLKLKAKTENFS